MNHFRFVGVDEENRIYFLDPEGDIPTPDNKDSLYRCAINEKELSCEEVITFPGYLKSMFVLPNGDVVYLESNDTCIRRASPGQKKSECIVDRHYGDETYNDISLKGVSPDGGWLAFKRYSGRTGNDLFVLRLED
jgi:hypothetical protein